MSSKNGRLLLVFAKEPAPGKAKTRLAATVGTERAFAFAQAFLDDTLEHAAAAASLAGARLRVLHEPPSPETRDAFAVRARRLGLGGVELRGQDPSPSLGVRLEAAFRDAFTEAAHVVAIGTDSPDLSPEDYARAFAALEGAPAVLGPARDGGYWLVGLAGPATDPPERAFLDPIAWSTERAFADTVAAFERRGLRVAILAEREDVDEAPDLDALASRLRRDPGRAPRTAAFLAGNPGRAAGVAPERAAPSGPA